MEHSLEVCKVKLSSYNTSNRSGFALTVTDLRVMPWYVPMVSILKPSVSEKTTQATL